MKRAILNFVRGFYRGDWIQSFLNVFRRKASIFFRAEVKNGSLSLLYKAAIYSVDINSKLKTVLGQIPSDVSHPDLSSFYTDKILLGSEELGLPLDKLLLDLTALDRYLKLAREPKKPVPQKVSSILFVTSMFPSVEHGGGLKVFDTIQELVALGYKVSLYSFFHEDHDMKSYQALLPSLSHVRLVDLKTFSSSDFNDWLNRKDLNFDLAHYVWPHVSGLIPNNHARIRCHVFEFIETTARRCIMEIEDMVKERNHKKMGQRLFDLIESMLNEARACAYADKFICITEKDAEFSRDLYKIPEPSVVQIGVSRHAILDRLNDPSVLSIPVKPLSVGFIGNYNHYPNIDGVEWYLDKVHPHVLSKVPNYSFHVIGYGLKDSLKKKYEDVPSVQFVGSVDDVIKALAPLQVCVAPLITGAGFRVKLNQFSILKKPTVSTSIGACGMPYEDGKSIFISDDPKDFAEDIVTLLTDRQLNSEMGREAYLVVEKNYFWGPHIKKLLWAYEN